MIGDIAAGGIRGLVEGFGTAAKGIGGLAKDIRTAITGEEALSAEQRIDVMRMADELERKAADLEQSAATGQQQLNVIDAQSGSMFKGGWRPAIGWICASGLFYNFILRPILPWAIDVVCLFTDKPVTIPKMPGLNMPELMALTFALLGFGGLRMYERVRGVHSK
jgi:hypothetical protein